MKHSFWDKNPKSHSVHQNGPTSQLTVVASDRAHTTTHPITLTVTDTDEPGTINLSTPQPQVNTTLTATLTDPDHPQNTTWTWERTTTTEWTPTPTTTPHYTPTTNDINHHLRVTATYNDTHGTNQTAQTTTPHPVTHAPTAPPSNTTPNQTPENPTEQTDGDNTPHPVTHAPTPTSHFSDLHQAGNHTQALQTLATKGVLTNTGCQPNQLCPNQPITRWEMAVWLTRTIDGHNPTHPNQPRFQDTPPNTWWTAHTERLAQLGITTGCTTNPPQYCPHQPVTRAQMATFLTRAFQLPPAPPAGFTDTTHHTHHTNINTLYAAGITVGCHTNPLQYCPNQPTTRAQMAT